MATLGKYYQSDALEDGYMYSDSGIYYAPSFGNIQSYRDYINTLPLQDGPEVFGLHENANINYQRQESDYVIETVLSIQSRIAGTAGGLTPDQIVEAKCKQLESDLPEILLLANG
jgi:dynein heavy chain, axonemal